MRYETSSICLRPVGLNVPSACQLGDRTISHRGVGTGVCRGSSGAQQEAADKNSVGLVVQLKTWTVGSYISWMVLQVKFNNQLCGQSGRIAM